MNVRLRTIFDSIPTYRPGQCPDEETGAQLIKMSSNELPWSPSASLLGAVEEAFSTLNRYPDFYKVDLSERLAEFVGTKPENIFADDGSGTLLQDLVRIVVNAGDEVIFGSPSFAAYDIDVVLAGGVSVKVPLDDSWTYDLEGCERAITGKTRMILLCNPNNPTGTFLTTAAIRRFLDRIPDDILVVVDEAYRDFVTAEPYGESKKLVDEYDNVVLLRTFSKAFGMAGLRLGYGIARPEIVDAVNKVVAEFSVSTLSQAVGVAMLSDRNVLDDLKSKVDVIKQQREAYERFLRDKDVSYIPSQANFIMIPGDADRLFAQYRKHNLIVRPFESPNGVRITVGTPEQMAIAREVWQ
ncbi:histidinol-phosphate transaminase [Bifidobacterium biavatii]|uniref:Histidinol-phosphate aminotransferase n=1 Tax=Bifidobacterium biavatii DSM 23969 TaxID=1437608 RepID=A0A087A1S6_9BIFI|nr:histidinol-phosphate transaminase [Bifidobacterium biavatii]KFI52726.1 aminotransferase [Bifidobacterium biavatii DSM 23969]